MRTHARALERCALRRPSNHLSWLPGTLQARAASAGAACAWRCVPAACGRARAAAQPQSAQPLLAGLHRNHPAHQVRLNAVFNQRHGVLCMAVSMPGQPAKRRRFMQGGCMNPPPPLAGPTSRNRPAQPTSNLAPHTRMNTGCSPCCASHLPTMPSTTRMPPCRPSCCSSCCWRSCSPRL